MRSPVTLGVALGCAIATLLASRGFVLTNPLAAWLVHVDVQHLVVDLLTWTLFGTWLERRSGSWRMGAWVVAGLAASLVAHGVAFPEHRTLYGLSAVSFFAFAAGLSAYALDSWWGWVMMAGVAGVLAHEWMTGGQSAAEQLVDLGFGSMPRLLPGETLWMPVPPVHVACAVSGVAFGCLAQLSESSRRRRAVRRTPAAVPWRAW